MQESAIRHAKDDIKELKRMIRELREDCGEEFGRGMDRERPRDRDRGWDRDEERPRDRDRDRDRRGSRERQPFEEDDFDRYCRRRH